MQVDREKLWIVQHELNPVWRKHFKAGEPPTLSERKKLLGVRSETMASWLKKPLPRLDPKQLSALISAVNFLIESSKTHLDAEHFKPEFPIDEFWSVFDGDAQTLEDILDDLFLSGAAGLTPHLVFSDEGVASALQKRLVGISKVARTGASANQVLPLLVKSVRKIAKDQFVIAAAMAVPRGPNRQNPFFYRGVVCELQGALYWVFSSVHSRNKDMVFMVTQTIGHIDTHFELKGSSLTVSQTDTSKAWTSEVTLSSLTRDWPGGIAEHYNEIMNIVED